MYSAVKNVFCVQYILYTYPKDINFLFYKSQTNKNFYRKYTIVSSGH